MKTHLFRRCFSSLRIMIAVYLISGIAFQLYAQPPVNRPNYGTGTPINYVRTWTATAPTSNSDSLIKSGIFKVKEATQYFDGLGRPLQTVVKKGALATNAANILDTSGAKDLVTPVLYDEFGREQYKFSPFAANNAGGNSSVSDGQFKLNPFAQQDQFMAGKYGSQGESNYYSQTVFEASPLNRVQEQFAPGKNWAGSWQATTEETRHSIKSKYRINTIQDSVRIWEVTDGPLGSGGTAVPATVTVGPGHTTAVTEYKASQSITFTDGFYAPSGSSLRAWITSGSGTPSAIITSGYASSRIYPAGELYKNVTVDEQGKQVIEFKDKEGKVILKKVQLLNTATDNGQGSGHAGWICTYYIYDDLGNLRCVIQPEGVKALMGNGWQLTPNLQAEQCFRYEYDGRQRMIVKQVPSAAEVVMVYDVRDRLVMTQDGNLRSQGLWNYTLYDYLNRPGKTGLVNLSNNPNNHWTAAMAKTGDTNEAVQYPVNDSLQNATVLTETFYDDYDWVTQAPYASQLPAPGPVAFSDYDNSLDAAGGLLTVDNPNYPYEQKNVKDSRTKGMVTGTRIKVLNDPGNRYLYTLSIYDAKGRVIQVKSVNQTGGLDLVTTQYSWSGQPLTMVSREQKGGTGALTLTTITKNSYDALGRVVKTTKNVSSNTGLGSGDKIIAVNKYDELGQLVNKTLGAGDANGTSGAETQAYEYNVRGWLLGMNRGYLNNSASDNFFGFDLAYDKASNSSINTALQGYAGNGMFNGNITGMTWRGATGAREIRRYDFSYDNTNRILNADFKQYNGSGYTATETFNSRMGDGNPANPESAYDYNGNIKSMTQQGLAGGNSLPIDQLTYSYLPGSNKLAKVTDLAGDTRSYQLGDFNDGTNSGDDYAYDINGNLTKDENKNISSISYNILNLPEQIDVTGKGTIRYQYDAAGNKLSKTVNETGQGQKITTYLGGMIFENDVLQHVAMEEGRFRPNGSAFTVDYFLKDHLGNVRSMINENKTLLEETHYYPFGLTMKGISTSAFANVHNKEKTFQNQQLDEDLDLNWVQFKYRNHDPQIGRFIEIDPLSDKYTHNSTYAFSENKVVRHVELEGLESAPFEYMNGRRLTKTEIGVANKIARDIGNGLGNVFVGLMSPFNAIAENHIAGNIDDPVKKREHLQAADYWGKEALINYGGGFLFGKGVQVIAASMRFGVATSVWGENALVRGLKIEQALGGNLPENFPVIDKFADGLATSIKSIDLTAATYGKGNNLFNTLKGYVNKLDDFNGATFDKMRIGSSDITGKALEVAVQPGKATLNQWEQIGNAMKYAKEQGIEFKLQFVK
ncbi:MAG: hypothetical protein J7599_12450 [Niabella sp.]|nr:hypothetical protein [Niabella sp.]